MATARNWSFAVNYWSMTYMQFRSAVQFSADGWSVSCYLRRRLKFAWRAIVWIETDDQQE